MEMDGRVKLRMEFEIILDDEDIDDIMMSALEGGISYWCDEAEPVGDYLGEYASEQISRGGQLKLHDFEEDQVFILTKQKFVEGVRKYLSMPAAGNVLEFAERELRIDPGSVDAMAADTIVQYALFGDVIYG